jgi:hypothetical protein
MVALISLALNLPAALVSTERAARSKEIADLIDDPRLRAVLVV